jgi:cation transport regulator
MPYDSNADLPDNLQHILPEHAQDIYREAFNTPSTPIAATRGRRRRRTASPGPQ